MKTVAAAEANRQFSRLLSEVERGETIQVTSHGRPVARLIPEPAAETASRDAAFSALLERLRAQPARNLGGFTRDDLYDDRDDFA